MRDGETYLKVPVLRLDGDDLVPHELQDSVHYRFEALQNLLVREGHIALLDTSLRKLGLDTDINSPFLTVVSEICLDSVLEVHDAFGIHLACSLGAIGKLHLPDLGAQDVAEVPVQRCGTARVTRACRALRDRERLLLLNLIGDQIHSTTTTVDNQNCVMHLEIQQTGLGAKHCCCFGLSNQRQPIIVFIPKEPSLNRGGPRRSFAGIVPDGRHGEIVADVALLAVEDFAKGLLQLVAHCLAQVEKVVGRNIDLGLAWRKRRQVDWIDVGVTREH